MKVAIRSVVVLITALSTFYSVYWIGGGLLLPLNLPEWVFTLGSIVAAIAAAWYVWVYSASSSGGLFSSIGVGALVIGAIGFLAGFFGPILYAPDANQGPLMGIFITGPLGFLLGAVGGGVYWLVHGRHNTKTGHDDPSTV